MNEFKFQFVNLLLLGLVVGGIYWAFGSINNGITYTQEDVVVQTTAGEVNTPSVTEDQQDVPDLAISFEVDEEEIPVTSSNEKELTTEEKLLVEKLQGLIDDNINMKQGSFGTRVGTVQKFLNIYFDTNKTADNDYGPGTFADVKKFQSAEGLGSDGLAGPATYKKMIEILKK